MFESWPRDGAIEKIARIDDELMKAEAAQSRYVGCHAMEVPTFFGDFGIAASAFGVLAVFPPGYDDLDVCDLTSYYGMAWAEWGRKMAVAGGIELMGYSVDECTVFETPVDLSYLSPFQQDVLQAVRTIPFGETMTVKELAKRAGHPRKCAPVTNVLRHNPAPVIVPCHRVVPTGGGTGDWSGYPGFKQFLLQFEGHTVTDAPVLA